MMFIKGVFLSVMVTFSLSVFAQEQMSFSSELNKIRYQSLVEELRCPKCQNQNLADSGSGIAVDLRELVHQMIEQGKTDQEIVDYMVARYGSFVLYRPQHSTATFFTLVWAIYFAWNRASGFCRCCNDKP